MTKSPAASEEIATNEEIEAELTRKLRALEPVPMPASLTRSLEAKYAPRAAAPRVPWTSIAMLAAGVLLGAIGARAVDTQPTVTIAREAVDDHLRFGDAVHPLDVEVSDFHQVKPWLTEHLDFAPEVAFQGNDDFPLAGGSLARLEGRRAAAFVFHRRLHRITLFVVQAEGLAWPSTGASVLPRVHAVATTIRGFHTITWRDGDLGYVLVSDLSEPELERLGGLVVGAP